MQIKFSRVFTIIFLLLIVLFGIFKNYVLKLFSSFLFTIFGAQNYLFRILQNQAINDEQEKLIVGWVLYYPSYLLFHVLFIAFLFSRNHKARNILILSLISIVSIIVICWAIFTSAGNNDLAFFFRDRFHHLFGLPFILLIIEGGRILYNDLTKLTSDMK